MVACLKQEKRRIKKKLKEMRKHGLEEKKKRGQNGEIAEEHSFQGRGDDRREVNGGVSWGGGGGLGGIGFKVEHVSNKRRQEDAPMGHVRKNARRLELNISHRKRGSSRRNIVRRRGIT